MMVQGEDAARYKVVRRDSCMDAIPSKTTLVSADDVSGVIIYRDQSGENRQMTLDARNMRIIRR